MNKIADEIKKVANQLEGLGKYKSANKMDLIYKKITAQNSDGSFADSIGEAVKDNMSPASAQQTEAIGAGGTLSGEVESKLLALLQDMYGKSLQVEAILFESKKNNMMDIGVLKEIQAIGTKLKNAINSVVTNIKGGGNKQEKSKEPKEDASVMTDETAMGELGKA